MICGTSPLGIRYAVRRGGSAAAWCALSIAAGTRDENGYHSGIAHFLEHTLFKGTSGKSAAVVNSFLERLGGELNAFTTKEEIVLHATTLKNDLPKAAGLLLEIAFDAQFPEAEINVEKGVVADEIASYKDSPFDDIYDCFEEKLFAGSPLSKPILGTEESVKSISSDELKAFRRQFFTPAAMVLTMVSPLPEEKMAEMAEKAIAAAGRFYAPEKPQQGTSAADSAPQQGPDIAVTAGRDAPRGPVQAPPFCDTVCKDNHEVNCIIGGRAPAMGDTDGRLATVLLCNMLGGPASNSILGNILREKNGWVYNVDCSYTPYKDNGIAVVQFGCDKENLGRCRKTVLKQIRRLQETELSEARLKAAKRQLLGQNAIGMESGEAQCIAMGKNIMCFGKVMDDKEIVESINAIPAQAIRKMACEIFAPETLCTLIYE